MRRLSINSVAVAVVGALVLASLLLFSSGNDKNAEAAYGVIPDPSVVMSAVVYAVLYSGALIAVGCGVFARREFR